MLSDLAAYLSTYGEQHGNTGIRSSEESLARLRVAEDRGRENSVRPLAATVEDAEDDGT